jgi:hypothetical protein
MIQTVRSKYNDEFTDEKYASFLEDVSKQFNHTPIFRIAETPIFIGKELKNDIIAACEELNQVIMDPDFKKKTEHALVTDVITPNESNHSLFLQYDFGICQQEDGSLIPKLIELQGFPTLYLYQDLVARLYRKHFNIPDNYSHLFSGHDTESYIELLRKTIVGDANPENVVLLEIEPHTQATQIDFWATSHVLGIKVLCITELKKEGRKLFYINEKGKKIPIHRIYNRIIFDELFGRKDLKREFFFKDDVDVHWVGHPNWFFRISKSTLPLFKSKYVPKSTILSELKEIPEDLHNYVLKPLYSFSGSGVIFHVTKADIEAIVDKSNFILQEKVTYSPVVQSPDGMVKCEVRMLSIWEENTPKPILINNLARLSKGELIGVKFNKDKTWVGGSVGFFEQ